MKILTLSALTLLSLPGVALAQSGGAHDKLFVLDVKIGMPVEGRPGFVCAKAEKTESGERKDRHCVKFVDDRCKGKPQAVAYKRYGEKAPKGCFLDYSSNATFLDDVLMQDPNNGGPSNGRKPLAHVHLTGTESEPSMTYKIEYMFAEDDLLAESSKLHQALVAKYGEPNNIHSGRMKWKIDSTELVAECTPNQYCEITVNDRKYEETVEEDQKEADKAKKRDAAPAPKL